MSLLMMLLLLLVVAGIGGYLVFRPKSKGTGDQLDSGFIDEHRKKPADKDESKSDVS
jgi:hypothetical protein